jgi:two-component sensor histidine kinase
VLGQVSSLPEAKKDSLLSQNRNVEQLIEMWHDKRQEDSSVYTYLTPHEWEFILEHYYKLTSSEDSLKNEIAFPLATTYHSLTKFSAALPILETLKTKKDSFSFEDYSYILIMLEEIYRANVDLEKAIEIREERIRLGYIKTFYDLYADVGLYDIAVEDFKDLAYKPEYGSFSKMTYYKKLGELYFKAYKIDSARANFKKGIAALKPILNTKEYDEKTWYIEYTKQFFYNQLRGNIVACNIEQGNYDNAIPILEEDILESYTINDVDNRIHKWLLMAKVYLHKQDFNAASRVLDSVYERKKQKSIFEADLTYLKLKGDYFKQRSKVDSSSYYFERYIDLRDSLDVISKKNQSIVLLSSLENSTQRTIIKKQRLELLNQSAKRDLKQLQTALMIFVLVTLIILIFVLYKNYSFKVKARSKIKTQNEELIIKNEENELLLKEVHHRVKNNLQTISSLLGLQSNTVEDETTKKAFLEGQNRVHSMALIHKRLYESDQFGEVAFKDYTEQLCSNLISSFGKTEVTKYIITSTDKLDVEKAVPIGLIVNEILTNTFKYGQSKDGSVKFNLTLTSNETHYTMSFQDFGKGFNVRKVQKTNSLGHRLIELLSRQLDGDLKIKSTSKGTSYKLTFPKEIV